MNEQKSQSNCLMFYPCSVLQEFTSRVETVCGIFLLLLLFCRVYCLRSVRVYLPGDESEKATGQTVHTAELKEQEKSDHHALCTHTTCPPCVDVKQPQIFLPFVDQWVTKTVRQEKTGWNIDVRWSAGVKIWTKICPQYKLKNNHRNVSQQNMMSLNVLCLTNSPKPPNSTIIIM